MRQSTAVLESAVLAMDLQLVNEHSGIPRQLFRQVSTIFTEMLRRHHVVFAVFWASDDSALLMTRPQRAVVLACLVFTSMCVTAMLLGRHPDQMAARVIAGLVSAACMVPCRVLLPKLYRLVNVPPKLEGRTTRPDVRLQNRARPSRHGPSRSRAPTRATGRGRTWIASPPLLDPGDDRDDRNLNARSEIAAASGATLKVAPILSKFGEGSIQVATPASSVQEPGPPVTPTLLVTGTCRASTASGEDSGCIQVASVEPSYQGI